MPRVILIALDSVGIDPLGHNRPESVYSQSRFLFPRLVGAEPLPLPSAPCEGALVETVVAAPDQPGAIECAITYTSIFSGRSALDRHGLMRGLGLNEPALQQMIREDNLFRHFAQPCLANAIFPIHLSFLGGSYVEDLIPSHDRAAIEAQLAFDGRPIRLRGPEKHGFAELFTLGEINQNIFVHAARAAGVELRDWDDVRNGRALTGTMTHELEGRFNWEAVGVAALARREPREAAEILLGLGKQHDFIFYKYQLADLISHTGRVDLARKVFAEIELFVEALLLGIDARETVVIITSDHGHLEQVAFSHGHPKSRVPTWYFGPNALTQADRLRRPEAIFHVVAECAGAPNAV
jgi:phosphopentomutase/2,3-bisphosphoglycerate-independent phosphoglycerate mutase family metalloenzyme